MSFHYGFPNRYNDGSGSQQQQQPYSSGQDTITPFYNSNLRNGGSRHGQRASVNLDDFRAGLTRRNTTSTQSSAFGLPPIGQQRKASDRPTSGQFSFPVRTFLLKAYGLEHEDSKKASKKLRL